jgi:hypothetical protein
MKTFTVYRRNVGRLTKDHTPDQMNPPDVPQFEGCVFSDGTCVVRWLTAVGSTSVFESFDALERIHGNKGHPDYQTEVVWH